ncbi:MAG: hypothetical protein IBX47_09420, partial [Desulfuromonadales bacterium]|nr:hypothetical protein [Desulfuromonadales bacterium]
MPKTQQQLEIAELYPFGVYPLFGYAEAEVVGQPFSFLVKPEGTGWNQDDFLPLPSGSKGGSERICYETLGWRRGEVAFPIELSISRTR